MRILLDESIPADMATELPGFEVSTVVGMGWAGMKNGVLLRQAEGVFDVLVTMDQNLPHQQKLTGRRIGVLIIRARSNRMDDLRPLLGDVRAALAMMEPGVLRYVI